MLKAPNTETSVTSPAPGRAASTIPRSTDTKPLSSHMALAVDLAMLMPFSFGEWPLPRGEAKAARPALCRSAGPARFGQSTQ